jgi:hypothetical protein
MSAGAAESHNKHKLASATVASVSGLNDSRGMARANFSR